MWSKAQDLDFYLPVQHFLNSKRDHTELKFLESTLNLGKDLDKYLTDNGLMMMGGNFGEIESFNVTKLRNELTENPQSSIILVEDTLDNYNDNFHR
jgi:hypothetical protein